MTEDPKKFGFFVAVCYSMNDVLRWSNDLYIIRFVAYRSVLSVLTIVACHVWKSDNAHSCPCHVRAVSGMSCCRASCALSSIRVMIGRCGSALILVWSDSFCHVPLHQAVTGFRRL